MNDRGALQVELIRRAPGPVPDLSRLVRALEEAAGRAGAQRSRRTAVSVVLVGDDEIAALSGTFRGCTHATDVLSFATGEDDPETGVHVLGEIVVSVDTARREAARRNLPVERELLLYAVHGMLHLLGREDETEAGRTQMAREQEAVLATLGFGEPGPSATT